MLLICGYPIPAFEARTVLCNNSSVCDDSYNNLWRAIARSKADRDGHNYIAGQELKMKTEFYDYGQNSLFIYEEDEKIIYLMILHGRVFEKTEEIDDAKLKMFLSKTDFNVYDSYGKKLKIDSYSDLVSFVSAVKASRNAFSLNLDKYRSFKDDLQRFRNEHSNAVNCRINEAFVKLLTLCDDISKEFSDLLYEYYETEETKLVQDFFIKPSETERICNIFGIYIAVLKAYLLNYDGEPMSLDEKIYKNFLIEFSNFVNNHKNILENYAKKYNLKKREVEEIDQLLKEQGIYEEWNTKDAALTIL